jgi:WD40 repeat protein
LFPAKLLLNLIGDKVAAVFTNKTLKIWQSDLTRSSTYNSNNEITSMIQLNDSNLFISECNKTSQHNHFRLFDSTQLTSSPIQYKINSCVTALKSFMFNRVEFIAVGNGNQVQLLNKISSTQLMIYRNLSYHNDSITCFDYNSNSSLLASGSADFSIGIWNMASYKTKYTTKKHTDQVNIIILLSNGSMLATGSRDTTIKIWNKTNLNLIATLDAQITTNAIVSLGNGMFASGGSIKPDGNLLIF